MILKQDNYSLINRNLHAAKVNRYREIKGVCALQSCKELPQRSEVLSSTPVTIIVIDIQKTSIEGESSVVQWLGASNRVGSSEFNAKHNHCIVLYQKFGHVA